MFAFSGPNFGPISTNKAMNIAAATRHKPFSLSLSSHIPLWMIVTSENNSLQLQKSAVTYGKKVKMEKSS